MTRLRRQMLEELEASQLLSQYDSLLHRRGRRLRALPPTVARSVGARADPSVPSASVPRSPARGQHRGATPDRAAVLLLQDAAQELGPEPDTVSEEAAPTAKHSVCPGSGPVDRRRRQRLPPHDPNDALRHRGAPGGADAASDPGHRLRAHGRSRSRRQGPQRPRRDALRAVAGPLARAHSPTAAQAQAVAIPRRERAQRR